jgi:hypothetical protein
MKAQMNLGPKCRNEDHGSRESLMPKCLPIWIGLLASSTFCRPSNAGVYNLHLVTDNAPDYTDLASLVESATGNWQTPQDRCIAIWRWGRRARHQMSCATEGGRYILDPVLHFNSYGAMNCGIISLLNIACWRQLGYQGRYIQLGDHTVSEVSWDDGKTWHLFDSSMSIFCYNHDGQVASCDQIRESHACELSGGKSEPGHYYLYHYAPACGSHPGPSGWRCAADQPVAFHRTLEAGASSYTDGFDVDRYCQYAHYGHRCVLNLRPYESYTRYWTPLNRDRQGTESDGDLAYFRPMPNGSDPDGQSGENHIRGNGRWVFEPNLSNHECRKVFFDDCSVALRSEGGTGPNLHPRDSSTPAWIVFKVYAANVITSMQIEATGLRASRDDSLGISISRDAGLHWQPVWHAEGTGPQAMRLALQDEVAGVTQCLVKIEMHGAQNHSDVGLDSFRVVTITQLNRLTLPKLTLGANEVLLRADDQVETTELWPALHERAYRQTAVEEDNVFSDEQPDGMYKATLGAGVNGRECSVTWRLAVPTDITAVTYGVISTNRSPQSWVSLRRSWDGSSFEQFHLNNDGDFPFDEQVLQSFTDAPPGARQAYFRGVFFCKSGAATYNMPGVQDLLLRVSHKPRDAAFQPIEVTYHWTEHREEGDVIRSHTEAVRSVPHRYTINVAGRRDPTMHWVRMNLQGHSPRGRAERCGYSDGMDVGPGWERPRVTYRWGRNLAAAKPYTASRSSSSPSGNPDSDGRELTNGIVIAPTDYVRDKAVQPATAFWDPGEPVTFVVDLENQARIAGVRVSTHQPNAHFCHPAVIEVDVSEDGERWQSVGAIRHDEVWNPPGDYEPWEHDDSPAYASLPAGGRLAYSFPLIFDKPCTGLHVRFVCTPLDGKGMGISELQMFDHVDLSTWPTDVRLSDQAP